MKEIETEGEKPAFLANVADDINAAMIENILEEAEIPVMRKYPETGQYLHFFMGKSIYGVELYVPAEQLNQAKDLVSFLFNPEDVIADEIEPGTEE